MIKHKQISSVSDLETADLPSIPYYIVVSADHGAMTMNDRVTLANLLVETKAMHVAAHGRRGTLLDEAVDEQIIEMEVIHGREQMPVMTTWHDNETLDDVLAFMSVVEPFNEWGVKEWPTMVLKIEQ